MREQVSFAVDVNGMAHYVSMSPELKDFLSLDEQGAAIDEWPGDFPGNFEAGFYSATLDAKGSIDHPILRWSSIQKLTAYPPWAKVTKLPLVKDKEPKIKKKAEPMTAPIVRVRRKGEVLV